MAIQKRIDVYSNAEKIFLIDYILNNVKISSNVEEKGYRFLIKLDVLKAAYPLHDSDYTWKNEGPVTETQVFVISS